MLERIDYTVRHVVALSSLQQQNDGDRQLPPVVPPIQYSVMDCLQDFMDNPGGIFKVGGSDEVDEYPEEVIPRGNFSAPHNELLEGRKIALIGHSAGGWICRIYLSDREYGGKAYHGTQFVHSLVTLGTPHCTAPGPAFRSVEWCNRERVIGVRGLAVGSTGWKGGNSGGLTQNSYAFCSDKDQNVTDMDGDGITPIQSALAMEGDHVERLALSNVHHYPWSDAAGPWGHWFASELTADHQDGKPWYGDDHVVDQWAEFLLRYVYS
jgi:hypothetical protein